MILWVVKIGVLATVAFGQDLSRYPHQEDGSGQGIFIGYENPTHGGATSDRQDQAAYSPQVDDLAYEDYEDYPLLEEHDHLDPIASVTELLPLFLVALAAVVVAQMIFLPLIAPLLDPTNLGPVLAPVGSLKIDIVNILLAPFGLALCTLAPTVEIASGRSVKEQPAEGFTTNAGPHFVEQITQALHSALEGEGILYHLILDIDISPYNDMFAEHGGP